MDPWRGCRRVYRREGRGERRQEFLVDVAQGAVVEEEGFVNFGEAFENGGVGGEFFAHFDEGANDVNAHGNCAGATENVGSHEGTVLGEGAYLLGKLEFPQGYHSL